MPRQSRSGPGEITMPPPQAPIIVKKKAGGHGGHHGGAWKVAYADFVTAMMALFIVLWLMSSTTKEQKEEIAGYFRDPHGSSTQKGPAHPGQGASVLLNKQDMTKLKQQLLQSIQHVDPLDKLKKQIEITITPEGLRIELIEDAHGTFFETGKSQPTPLLVSILKVVSSQLGTLPNRISIEGHTDAQPYSNGGIYSNWELSSDRANVARRLMQASGVRLNQVSQVRGFADQRLRDVKRPFDASNRRISMIVQYLEPVEEQSATSIAAAVKSAAARPDRENASIQQSQAELATTKVAAK